MTKHTLRSHSTRARYNSSNVGLALERPRFKSTLCCGSYWANVPYSQFKQPPALFLFGKVGRQTIIIMLWAEQTAYKSNKWILFQVKDCNSVSHWTNQRVSIWSELQVSTSVDCTQQVGKLENKIILALMQLKQKMK